MSSRTASSSSNPRRRKRSNSTPFERGAGTTGRWLCAAALALSAASLLACGGISGNAIVLRVGDQRVSKATVDHWAEVIGRGGAFNGFRGPPPHGTPERRALTLLISSNWLIGE